MSVGGSLSGQWVKKQYRRESSSRSHNKVCVSTVSCPAVPQGRSEGRYLMTHSVLQLNQVKILIY